MYKYCNSFNLVTDDRKIAGSWNLLLNSNMIKYFKNTQYFSTRLLLFLSFCNKHILYLASFQSSFLYTFHLFPVLFHVTSFLIVAIQCLIVMKHFRKMGRVDAVKKKVQGPVWVKMLYFTK